MAKKTLQEQHPESIKVQGYAPIEELNYMCRQYEYLVEYKQRVELVNMTELKAAIESKKAEVGNNIQPIADEFNIQNIDRLIEAIKKAYQVPDIHKHDKLLKQYKYERVEALLICCKEMQSLTGQLGMIDKSLLSSSYDGEKIDDLIASISVEAGVVGRVATKALTNLPEREKLSKRKSYWWFVEVLADFWKAEIKEKPKCNHSVATNAGATNGDVGGYTGEFYRFVVACTELDREKLGVGISNGSTIKNVLKEWSITNPM